MVLTHDVWWCRLETHLAALCWTFSMVWISLAVQGSQWLRIQEVGEVRNLAFALPSDIRELPSFSGQTPKFSWRLDLTCDQNGLELLDIC